MLRGKNVTSLLEVLSYRAQYQSEWQAYIFLQNGETESASLTYGELDSLARQIAAHLQSWQGERALLLYPSGLEFVTAFFGCLYAGVIAVPVYPPRQNQKLSRLLSIVNDAQAKVALTTKSILGEIEKRWLEEAELAPVQLVATDTIETSESEFAPQSVTPESLAFLQYTSGSTGTPKGVMVTHRNIIHNQQLLHQACGHSENTIGVGWLPLFHDMGLIGNVLQPIYVGFLGILMPPVAFLQKPIRWLKAISNYRATTSGSPNFAYDLCVKKVQPEQLADLDLSSWDVAFIGAEPIRAKTLEQFGKKFARCGFNYRAFYPCYGMAETTLFATGGDKNQLPVIQSVLARELEQNSIVETEISSPLSRVLVGVGRPYMDTTVIIVNPESLTRYREGLVGEIWMSGGSIASGYWNRSQATQETFQAHLKDTGNGPFLRTGDLGFLSNGELFVTGRLKDVIIISGRNHYPQDIELTVENSHPALRSHCSAAFSIEMEDSECLMVACEVERTYLHKLNTLEVVRAIQIAVSTEHELEVYEVVLLKTGSIPKTSSGKIQRRACQLGFLEESLNVVGQWQKTLGKSPTIEYVAPRKPSEEIIANIFAAVLGIQAVGIHDNFFELGGHSLLATQLISRLRQAFHVEISLRSVFESPSVAQLDQTITQLRTTGQESILPAIQPVVKDTRLLPLSWAQKRLWFLNQLEGASATYNIPAAVRLTGHLEINALQQALSSIVERHEVLRTSFPTVNGTPVQVIHPAATMNIDVVDLEPLVATQRETVLSQEAHKEAITPFDLELAPLIRWKLLHLSATEHVLLLTMHHIVSDGWSMGVLIEEFSKLYQAYRVGEPSPLPALAIQYADFAVWQRQCFSGEIRQNQLNYWLAQLAGAPELLQLPTDRTRPSVQTFRGTTQTFSVNRDLTLQLQTLSRESGTTLFMTLLAAFATLLYRYSGQSDILIGSPIANRNHREIESLIGFFVNTLVLRTRFEENPSFESLLAQVRETTLQAYEHQDVPFEQVVEALQPQRCLSHSPLFQVMFILQNTPTKGTVELPGVTLSQLEQESTIAKFDLTLSIAETAQGLVGQWEYNTGLFDGSTIERMAIHFQNLLSAIVENPQQAVSELPLLSEAERHQLLVEWNDTKCEYPSDKCIHQLFEEQVEQTPDAVAVVFEHQQLTYQQLNQRANQLAHYLQTLGVGPEVLVGICVERSVEMVVGLLGILKAGGAYVALDPSYPQDRLSYILADAGVEVLLTQTELLLSLPSHTARLVCLDTDWRAIEQHTERNLDAGVKSDNLAYVIYTSGSTGQPKGVQICHYNVVNCLNSISHFPGLTQEDTFNAVTTISFDIATLELFLPLTVGAKVIVTSREIASNGNWLLSELFKSKTTVMQATPATWQMLLASGWSSNYPLKVLCGGEALSTQIAAQILETGSELWNLYGPTEATIWSTIYKLGANKTVARTEDASSTIGRPIANTQIYILDSHLQPVPIGVPGELYISGDGLAKSYLNHPELTQEKFIPNPFSNSKCKRLYKTGDLAYYNSDGSIKFLGRIDNQVKLRGFRIELGEIESVLNTHPQIQQTVVIAREDIPGNKRLVAYVVTRDELLTTHQLREFIKQKLPEYMVPSAFVTLDILPLTANGKVDHRALPAPLCSLRELENNFVAPSTPTEETLAAIWAEVLGLQQVGIHDNFLELGGHSLLATSVISRIQEAFKIELLLRHLFEAPTIASLSQVIETVRQAGLIERSSSGKILDALPPLLPTTRDTHIPLSFAQEYIWYVQQLNPDSCKCNCGILPLRFNGWLSPEVVEKSINEIIRRHEILRTTFTVKEGQPVQVIAPSLTLPLKIVDLQDLPAAEREASAQRIVAEEFQHHFDLANGPLIKPTLLRLAPLEHWLLIPMHHIITDGWSIGIFLQELETLISAFSTGLPSSKGAEALTALPSVPLQYADFTLWERKRFNEEVLEKQLSYWLQKLADSPQPQDVLPSEQLQPTTNNRQASFYSLVLPESLVASIEALSRTHRVTTFVIIITALKILLFKWSGQTEILVVATTGNRSTPESERMLGCFINDVILRSLLWGSQTGLTLLEQVKETVNEAINHKEVPLQKVIEAVGSKRELTLSAGVTMEPPIQGLDGMSNGEIVPVPPICELWDEEIPLELYVSSPTEDSKTIEIALLYSTDLFTNESIERLFSYYQEILQKLVEYPEIKLSEF